MFSNLNTAFLSSFSISLSFNTNTPFLRVFITFLLLLIFSEVALSQAVTDDLWARQKIRTALDDIYNQKFVLSPEIEVQLQKKYPNHPINPMLKALRLFWSGFPVQYSVKNFDEYAEQLNLCYELADKLPQKGTAIPESIFFKALSKMMLAKFHADNKEITAAIWAAKDAYSLIKESVKWKEKYPEFLFITGLYNYYRVSYPEKNPGYKPFMSLFMDGDKELGLNELEISAQKSLFCNTDAKLFLTFILQHNEGKPMEALNHIKSINEKFPNNYFYTILYCENLLTNHKYDDALFFTEKLTDHRSAYARAVGKVLDTWAKEQTGLNPEACRVLYVDALKELESYSKVTSSFQGYAFLGIGRCYFKEHNYSEGVKALDRAIEVSQNPYIRREVKFIKLQKRVKQG